MRYYAYGATREGTLPTDRRYTGQRHEAGLGLYDYNARYYDPALGRFIQADTIVPDKTNPQDLNRYSYTRNNPMLYTDPSGHLALATLVIGGAVIGGLIGYGTQVHHNMQNGMEFQDALTTNIDPAPIVRGAMLGGAAGAAAPIVVSTIGAGFTALGTLATGGAQAACADGDCTNEARAAVDAVCGDGDCTNEVRDAIGGFNNIAEQINCFEAGTPILTSEGSVPIEDIQVGDYVLATDPESDLTGYYPVTEVFSRQVTSLLELTIGDEVLRVTAEHPFWVVDRGWVVAGDLVLGDCIKSADGTCQNVTSLLMLEKSTVVYNFTVDVMHTYFVGAGHWLAHNQCSGPGFSSGRITYTLKELTRKVGRGDAKKFFKALDKGVVGPRGESGVKKLEAAIGKYTYELKIGNSAQRILGYISDGELIFDNFERGGLH